MIFQAIILNITVSFGIFNWGLKPNKKLILDNSLEFKGLKILSKSSQFIHLINFKGFLCFCSEMKDQIIKT